MRRSLYVSLTSDDSLAAECWWTVVPGDPDVGLKPSWEDLSITLERRWTGHKMTETSFKTFPRQERLPLDPTQEVFHFFAAFLREQIEEEAAVTRRRDEE